MKNKVSSLIAEGILFCGSGILLLSYSLMSYAKSFNKAWSQSPYLFPALVGAAMIGLSLWIIGQGPQFRRKIALQLEKPMAEMPETVPVPIRSWWRF